MAVDEAGHHDHAGGVDHLGALGPVEPRRDRGDAAVLDQHVALRQLAELRIHGDDASARDQHARHVGPFQHYVMRGHSRSKNGAASLAY